MVMLILGHGWPDAAFEARIKDLELTITRMRFLISYSGRWEPLFIPTPFIYFTTVKAISNYLDALQQCVTHMSGMHRALRQRKRQLTPNDLACLQQMTAGKQEMQNLRDEIIWDVETITVLVQNSCKAHTFGRRFLGFFHKSAGDANGAEDRRRLLVSARDRLSNSVSKGAYAMGITVLHGPGDRPDEPAPCNDPHEMMVPIAEMLATEEKPLTWLRRTGCAGSGDVPLRILLPSVQRLQADCHHGKPRAQAREYARVEAMESDHSGLAAPAVRLALGMDLRHLAGATKMGQTKEREREREKEKEIPCDAKPLLLLCRVCAICGASLGGSSPSANTLSTAIGGSWAPYLWQQRA